MIQHLLYETTDTTNGMIYVGVHSTEHEDDGYIGSGRAFKEAVRAKGKDNFVREIIGRFDSRDALLQAEGVYVDEKFLMRNDTYNLETGGKKGNMKYGGGIPYFKGSRNQKPPLSFDEYVRCGFDCLEVYKNCTVDFGNKINLVVDGLIRLAKLDIKEPEYMHRSRYKKRTMYLLGKHYEAYYPRVYSVAIDAMLDVGIELELGDAPEKISA